MKAFTWTIFLLIATTLTWAESGWFTDFEKTKAIAKKTNKLILADFTGTGWCTSCIRLNREVFSKPAFLKFAKEKLVLLKLDFPQGKSKSNPQPHNIKIQNQKLFKKYKVRGFPSVLLLDADGNLKAKTSYRPGGPKAYITHLKLLTKGWLTDFKQAQTKAKNEGKLIFANFTGSDWCPPCMFLDREIFSKPAFLKFAKEKLVLLKLDFPRLTPQPPSEKQQNRDLFQKYKLERFPTILLLDADGNVKAVTGFQPGGPETYVAHLKKLVK